MADVVMSSAAVASIVSVSGSSSSKDEKRPSPVVKHEKCKKQNKDDDDDATSDEDFAPSDHDATGDSDAEDGNANNNNNISGSDSDSGEGDTAGSDDNEDGEEEEDDDSDDDDTLYTKVHPLFNFAESCKDARAWTGGGPTSGAFQRYDPSNRAVRQMVYVATTHTLPIWTNEAMLRPSVFSDEEGGVDALIRFGVAAHRSATLSEFELNLNLGLEDGHVQFLRLDKLPIRYDAFYSKSLEVKKTAMQETREHVFASAKQVHHLLNELWIQLRGAAADCVIADDLRMRDPLLFGAVQSRIASRAASFASDDALSNDMVSEFSGLVHPAQIRGMSVGDVFLKHWGTRQNLENFPESYTSLIPATACVVPSDAPAEADNNEKEDDHDISCDNLLSSAAEEKNLLWKFKSVVCEMLHRVPLHCINEHLARDQAMTAVRTTLSDAKKEAGKKATEANKTRTPEQRLSLALEFLRDLPGTTRALVCGQSTCHEVLQFAGMFRGGICGACHDRSGKLLCWHHALSADGDRDELCEQCKSTVESFCVSAARRRMTDEERARSKQEKLEKKKEAKTKEKEAKAESKRQQKEAQEREKLEQKARDAVEKAKAAVKTAKERRTASETVKNRAIAVLDERLANLSMREKNPRSKGTKALEKLERSVETAKQQVVKATAKLDETTSAYNNKLAVLRSAEAALDRCSGASPASRPPAPSASASGSSSSAVVAPTMAVFIPESPPASPVALPGPRPAKRRAVAPPAAVASYGTSSSSSPVAVPVAVVAPLTIPDNSSESIKTAAVVSDASASAGSKRKRAPDCDDSSVVSTRVPRFVPPPPPLLPSVSVPAPTPATAAVVQMDFGTLPSSQVDCGGYE